MNIENVYVGGWFQRTTLHLSEIHDFLKDGVSPLALDSAKLKTLRATLNIQDLEMRETTGTYDALAWALHQNGQGDAAMAAIDRALASGVKDPHLLLHAALIYARVGEDRRGAALVAEAFALNPLLSEFHEHR